jgi:hypothetical protein
MPGATGGNTITSTNQIANGVIEDADVSAAAAIAASKIAGDVEDTGDQTIAGIKTFSSSPVVPADAYAAGWASKQEPATKAALYAKIQTLASGFAPQDINLSNSTTGQSGAGSAGGMATTSESDGSVFFQAWSTGGVINIQRFARDSISLNYYLTHTTTFGIGNSGNMSLGLGIVGSNVYLILQDGATKKVTRYAKADLSGVQAMTWSGTQRAGTTWSDGTFLYIYNGTSDQFDKCSISGTTITNTTTTITLTSAGVVAGAISDGVSVWTTSDVYSGAATFKKYPIAGGASTGSVSIGNLRADSYPAGQPSGLFMVNGGMLVIPYWYQPTNATATLGTNMHLIGITAP